MNYIAYYRVSTKKQGESTLGLKAQQESVRRFLNGKTILHEFVEVETGTNKRVRPILSEAIQLCKKHDATLIIAKLDRLARNVAFVSSLMDAHVKFVAVDMPQANELTIHIMSAIAQHEAKIISTRIKEALAQSKKKLGNPQYLTAEAREKGQLSILKKRLNNPNMVRATAFLKSLDYENLSYTKMAEILNQNQFHTPLGKRYSACQVKRLIGKMGTSVNVDRRRQV
jgi:DNA invertase Pin-like site-specific DNA recombinase